jgi:hypothetical protein
MTVQSAFAALGEKMANLEERFNNLIWAVVQAQPEQAEEHPLAERFEDVAQDLTGLVIEARGAIQLESLMAGDQVNMPAARRALIACQGRCNQVMQQFCSQLTSHQIIEMLNSVTDPAWESWVSGVQDALRWCGLALHEANQALFQCWQELTDHSGLVSVSVSATSGQQIQMSMEPPGDATKPAQATDIE